MHQATAHGARRARYRGLPRTRLDHVYMACALNLLRLEAYWTGTRWTGSEPATWHASNSASSHDPELTTRVPYHRKTPEVRRRVGTAPPTLPAEYSRPRRRSANRDDGSHIVQYWAACPQRSSLRGDAANSAGAPGWRRSARRQRDRHRPRIRRSLDRGLGAGRGG